MFRLVTRFGLVFALTLALGLTTYGLAQNTETPDENESALCASPVASPELGGTPGTPGAAGTPDIVGTPDVVGTPDIDSSLAAADATPDATIGAMAATAVAYTCSTPESTPAT